MRIVITAENNMGLDSQAAHHFGKCPYFVFVNLEGEEVQSVQVLENPYANGHQAGQVPAFIHENKADVLISGGIGGRAIQFFEQYGIGVSTGASGTVKSTLEKYHAGELNEAAPCAESVAHGHGDSHKNEGD